MARSPIDRGQDSDASHAQDRPIAVTMIMNPPAGSGPSRAAQLRETMSMLPSAADTTPEAEEPTIEEYMTALLARTKQPATSLAETIVRPARPTVSKVVPNSPSPPAVPQPAAVTPVTAGPAAGPECRDAFSELRELANISARSTFNTHLAQRLVLEMHGKRFVAVVAMLASLILLSLATSVRSPAYLAAVAAVTAACVWSLKYLSLGRALARVCADAEADESADD